MSTTTSRGTRRCHQPAPTRRTKPGPAQSTRRCPCSQAGRPPPHLGEDPSLGRGATRKRRPRTSTACPVRRPFLEIADLDAGDGRIIELIKYIRPAGKPVRARSSDPGSTHIALRVDDLDEALARLEGSGARQISRHPVLLHDPGGAWDGVACCYIADPDGIIVELVQRPRAQTT